MKKVLLIINPNSGNNDKNEFANELKAKSVEFGLSPKFYWTNGKDDEERIKELLDQKDFDCVFAAGGDGTVLSVAEIIKGKSIPLGIIPLGTSNGLATDLKLSNDPIEAFNSQLNSKNQLNLDLIKLNRKHSVLHIGDIGANANLIKRFEESDTNGYAAYTKHFIDEFNKMKPFEYQIKTKDNIYKGIAYMIAFCNARRFGSGVPLTLNGHPADGKFELVVLKKINIGSLIKSTLSSIDQSFFEDEDREIIPATVARIEVKPEQLFQTDGEVQYKTGNFELQIQESKVRLLCSSSCSYIN